MLSNYQKARELALVLESSDLTLPERDTLTALAQVYATLALADAQRDR